MENKEILEFYKQTSQFTDLGYYKDFAKKLPDDIEELCLLQRMQIIHPVAYKDKDIRSKSNCFWGDMTLDNMGSEELVANLFRITQTESKLKRDNIST